MTRFACVFLPRWPVERFRRCTSAASRDTRPFALVASRAGGFRLTALDARAQSLGLKAGELLADARARVPLLLTAEAEPIRDREYLVKLARWCGRFSPYVAPWPKSDTEHGLTLDIAGCAHLFGGESAFARTILRALAQLGYSARIAIADSIGAAHALSRHGANACTIIEAGKQRDAISSIPVGALRIDDAITGALRQLGLARIGDLLSLPRAPMTSRFGPSLVLRLEQALGEAAEPLSPLTPHAPYRANATLAEPISAQDHVLTLIRRLAGDLVPVLTRDGKGARGLKLTLFRVDGETAELDIRLAQAGRDPDHIVKLFALRLDALAQDYDAGFGYEAARLDVIVAEPMKPEQSDLTPDRTIEREARLSLLIDRLGSRLGVENVVRLKPQDSHIPERAVIARAAAHHARADWNATIEPLSRPLLMLPSPEPAEVTALLPEGPPRQFRWRGVHYAVVHAEGPERIRPEWWRARKEEATRDYYNVEDEEGRRFWLYRDGPYGSAPPLWFVHGVFA